MLLLPLCASCQAGSCTASWCCLSPHVDVASLLIKSGGSLTSTRNGGGKATRVVRLQEYLSLPAGSFTFQAQATDVAGNVESSTATSSNSKSWTVSLPTTHAIITGRADSWLTLSDAA